MEAIEFKENLKQIKESLRGLTISFCTKYSSIPYYSLREFGLAVLEQEAFGRSFGINTIKTPNGIMGVKSFSHLLELLKTEKVQVVQFSAFKEYTGMEDLIRGCGRLD